MLVYTQNAVVQYRKHQGVSLIEVLVSLFVFSIGFLGLAELQLKSLQATRDSFLRTQANLLATSISESLKANVGVARSTNQYVTSYSELTRSSSDCFTTLCTPEQLANFDIFEWKKELAKLLPSGSGKIEKKTQANLSSYSITVRFKTNPNNNSIVTIETIP